MEIASRKALLVFGILLPALGFFAVNRVFEARAEELRSEQLRELRVKHGLPAEGPLGPGQDVPLALLDELGIQHGEYEELVVVVISSSTCAGNLVPGFKEAMRKIRAEVEEQATESGLALRMVGVSLDWDPRTGLDYLSGIGEFDEMTVGGNWINLATQQFIWGPEHAIPASVPVVAILRRTIVKETASISFGQARLLGVLTGGPAITEWVAEGAPVRVGGRSDVGVETEPGT